MAYHVLAQRDDGRWGVAFGDHDREAVEFERDDLRDHGIRARDLKIFKVPTAHQRGIDEKIDAMNI